MTPKKLQKKKKTDEKPTIIVVYEKPTPTLKSTFTWGNGRYCSTEEIKLEKLPKLVREGKEKDYE